MYNEIWRLKRWISGAQDLFLAQIRWESQARSSTLTCEAKDVGCSGVRAQEKPFGKLRFQVAHLWYLSCPAEYEFRVKVKFF